MNEDTASLQEFTYWILSKAHIQKHCVANMSRTDNYKTEENKHDRYLQRPRRQEKDKRMVSEEPRHHLPQ